MKKSRFTEEQIIGFLKQAGNILDEEMLRTFNNGIGMVAVVPENAASEVIERLAGMNEKSNL